MNTTTITIDLDNFIHIPEMSSRNHNWYKHKEYDCRILISFDEQFNTADVYYQLNEDISLMFLFTDENPKQNIYEGELGKFYI